jgi:hypothetical protein
MHCWPAPHLELIAHLPLRHSNFPLVSPQFSKLCKEETYDHSSVLDTARMRVLSGAAKRACVAGGAQIAPAEVDAAAAFEGRTLDEGHVVHGDWVCDGQEGHEGEDGEDLGELHVDGGFGYW